jgi:hypothetical protein
MAGGSEASPRPPLSELDKLLAELNRKYPGWRLWYVPTAVEGVKWCGHPLPNLACWSPDQLDEEIRRTGVTGLRGPGRAGHF